MAGKDDAKDEALAEKAYAAAAEQVPDVKKAEPVMDASSTDSKAATGTAVPADKPVEAAKPAAVAATPVPPAAATPTPVVAAAPKEASAPKAPAKPEAKAKPAGKAKPIAKAKPAAKVKVAAKPIVKGPAAKVPAPKPAPKPVAAKAIKPAAAPKAGTTRIIAKPAVAAPLAATPTAAAAARPAPAKIAPAKAGATKPAPAKPGVSSFAGLISNFMLEDTTMDMSANLSAFQDAVADAQTKAKAAFEKGTGALGELGDFTKGNLEAVVESGKILAEGLQGLGSELVSEGRTSFATMTGDIKELAAVKSPTDFFKLQGDIARKNFDSAVAYSSKNSEAMLKLMSDVMAPLSGRVSIAMEKVRHAAV
ncbi:phasin family protein [Sphingomonas sp. IC081]|uniref:phasin family protein n=1 Tax=Sphingomonas sp. IC081 TaxID=304378 RepID=UPI001159B4AC|nr:phasin family protein [Sphingomonas sp. IC081]QDK31455.1 phasin [Sphingomonas sp. IC081]